MAIIHVTRNCQVHSISMLTQKEEGNKKIATSCTCSLFCRCKDLGLKSSDWSVNSFFKAVRKLGDLEKVLIETVLRLLQFLSCQTVRGEPFWVEPHADVRLEIAK